MTLEDWVEMTDDGLGATPVVKILDVAVVASTGSTEVVKLTVSSNESLMVHDTVAEGWILTLPLTEKDVDKPISYHICK